MQNHQLLKKSTVSTLIACIVVCCAAINTIKAQVKKNSRYAVIGYVGGYRGLVDTSMVHAAKLTIINYAFVDVQHNRAWLTNRRTDTTNFKYLVSLKKDNPSLKVLISIGGWTWSKHFSDAVLSDTSRQAFAASAVGLIRQYHLDGIDIDWEYPAIQGDGNTVRPVDQQNYTLMFQLLRKGLDSVQHETGKQMLLTAAVGGFKSFIAHTEMEKVAKYLDYINLMTYDYQRDSMAIHHTNLYASKKYTSSENADEAVTDFAAAGVPLSKLVIGVAFYGHSANVADNSQFGLGTKTVKGQYLHLDGYTFIKDSLTNRKGFKYYKDRDAKAPYLYNPTTKQFITYDDEWSVKNKCRYVRKKALGGVMFWEYDNDKKEYLLNEIDRDF
jgi:chitinase